MRPKKERHLSFGYCFPLISLISGSDCSYYRVSDRFHDFPYRSLYFDRRPRFNVSDDHSYNIFRRSDTNLEPLRVPNFQNHLVERKSLNFAAVVVK